MPLYSIRGGNMGPDEYRVLNVPRVSVYRSATQAIGDSVGTNVVWNTVEYDSEGMWNGGTFLIAKTSGLYSVNAWLAWATNVTGYRQITVIRTTPAGSVTFADVVEQAVTFAGATTNQSVSAHIPLNAGDYIFCQVAQTSGGALNTIANGAVVNPNRFQACLISTLG